MRTPFSPTDLEHLGLYAGAIQVYTTGRSTAALGTQAAHAMADFLERARRDLQGRPPSFTPRDVVELRQLAQLLDQGLPFGSWDDYPEEVVGRMSLCRDISTAAKRVMRSVEERIG
ncbi:MAG: hypothetical protein HY700_13980 [Gemmatimonadetes bacterium]|nr:hypothetical protein [Gemmatimonadota bacterium]